MPLELTANTGAPDALPRGFDDQFDCREQARAPRVRRHVPECRARWPTQVLRWLTLWLVWGGVATRSQADPAPGRANRELPWVTPQVRGPRLDFCQFHSELVGGPVSYHVLRPANVETRPAEPRQAPTPQPETRPETQPAAPRPNRPAPASGVSPTDPTGDIAAAPKPDNKTPQSEDRLPVLYWLHGTEGGVGGIRPVARLFDEAIGTGRVPRMLVVFVNGLPRRLWSDSKDGSAPVESVFVREVIPDVDRRYRTLARREGRLLEGFSMGGYGAARLGLKHSDLFAGISILAGGPLDLDFEGPRAQRNPRLREQILREVCNGDLEFFRELSPWRLAEKERSRVRERQLVIRQVVGERDNTRELSRRFHERLTALGLEHDYHELPNVDHDAPGLWQGLEARLGERQGDFYRRALGYPVGPR